MTVPKIDFAGYSQIIIAHAPAFLLAALVFVCGRWASNLSGRGAERILSKAPNANKTLSRFLASLVRFAVLAFTIIGVLTIVGVDTSSLSAIVLGFGAGLAFILKDALSDVAAGVMLMIMRPYNLGDEVEIDGVKGVVVDIGIIATRMKTRNNIDLIVQNGKAWGGVIKNHSAFGKRRLDTVFGISYSADIDKAIAAMTRAACADKRVYKDPAPRGMVVNLGRSSVDIELRLWSDYNDMRAIKMDIAQPVKAALAKAGIDIPYPHEMKIIKT